MLTVEDDGAGIPARDRDRVLKFHVTKAGGTGIALPLVARIVREHRGELTIESEEGRGTRVRIVLPRWVAVVTVDASRGEASR